jgi:hypothetical protein
VILTQTRLIRLRALLDDPHMTIADASAVMHWSSPQALSRHLRVLTGVSPLAWCAHTTTDGLLDAFMAQVIAPYAPTWQTFDPDATTQEIRRVSAAQRYGFPRMQGTSKDHGVPSLVGVRSDGEVAA